jgi:hypothetical protein
VVMLTGDRNHIGCFTDQVKLTCALVRDLDVVVKEVKLLGEHEEESSQKFTELEALWKRLREDAQKLKEEKATLEGMIKSYDELTMDMAEEYGLNRMGENGDDKGNVTAPPALVPPAATPEEIDDEGPMEMIPEQEAPVPHKVILVDVEPEMSQPHIYHEFMRDYEKSPPRMMDDMDDLDDDPNEGCFDMDEWFLKDGSNDRD